MGSSIKESQKHSLSTRSGFIVPNIKVDVNHKNKLLNHAGLYKENQ